VLPLVPELLLVPAEPPVLLLPEGRVEVEPPEAPMPDVLPEDEVPPVLGLDEADEEPEGLMVPEAEPPDEPMPEAVPVALPEPEVPQAARAAVQAIARTYFIIAWFLSDHLAQAMCLHLGAPCPQARVGESTSCPAFESDHARRACTPWLT
jgi:hypothetical protein